MTFAAPGARWIAFLRAVNVGARKLPSVQLRDVCGALGLRDVRTHIQSGNVSFVAPAGETREQVAGRLDAALAGATGFEVPTTVREVAGLEAVLATEPFAAVETTKETRRFVLFFETPVLSPPALPFATPTGDVRVLSVTREEAFAVAIHGKRVPNTAAIVERAFGVRVTGRFEHTLKEILAAAAA